MLRIMFFIALLVSQTANALQTKYLNGDRKLVADISLESINRISVDDDRIAQVFGLNEDLVMETDPNTGQVFLRTKQNKPIDLSIITEKQVTLDLHLIPKNISGETIIIKINKPNNPVKVQTKSGGYVDQITTLMLAMASDKSRSTYTINKVHKNISLWDRIELIQTNEYVGNKLIGETYSLANNTKGRIFLTETQFGWQKGVASVAIKKHALAPNEKTQIYIIRHIL